MAQFSRVEVFQTMKSTGLVPLFYQGDIEVAKSLLTAVYEGGARVLEFTSRGDFAHEVFTELSKHCQTLPGMIIGVGSVTDAAAASHYMSLGANFIVTPVLREDIALVCNRRKVMWSPGCGSLADICRAEELGCEMVKLFPGGTYGPGFVKAIRGPQPWTNIMPTGGVSGDRAGLEAWFKSGVTCVGMGSKLFSKKAVAARDFASITAKVAEILETIKEVRA